MSLTRALRGTPVVTDQAPAVAVVEPEPATLSAYYETIQKEAYLPTSEHARRWSKAVLRTLGDHLDRNTRQALATSLPPELAEGLGGGFRLALWRNPGLPLDRFLKQAAWRGGNTDPIYARFPVRAVFRALQLLLSAELSRQVEAALPREVAAFWQRAGTEAVIGER